MTSKVGSLDNMKHKPGGGDKKIFDDKEYLKQKPSTGVSNNQSLSGSQVSYLTETRPGLTFTETIYPTLNWS